MSGSPVRTRFELLRPKMWCARIYQADRLPLDELNDFEAKSLSRAHSNGKIKPRHALGRRVWEGSTERRVLDRRRREGFRRCQLPGAGRPHESVLLEGS